MSKKWDALGNAASRILHITPDLLIGGMTVTLYGAKQAVVEGYRTILEYDDTILRVSDGKKIASIFGIDLMLREMSDEGLVVDGKIHSAEFEDLGGRH